MSDDQKPRTLAEAAADLERLVRVGKSSNGGRADSEWYHRHPLANAEISTEARDMFARWLARLAPRQAHTATATLVVADENGVPTPVLAAWLARLPGDAVVTQDGQTWTATWTEAAR
jgi:hypothetical protein